MNLLSQFILVAAMNLTPDWNMAHESKSSPREIQNYLGRIVGVIIAKAASLAPLPDIRPLMT